MAKEFTLQLQHRPSSEYSGLISFRIDWFDLLAVQGTLKSLLQHPQFKSINSSALSLLNGLALTAIHDYWKNYSFDYMNLCQLVDPLKSSLRSTSRTAELLNKGVRVKGRFLVSLKA